MRRTGTEDRRDCNSRRLRNAADGRRPLGLLVEHTYPADGRSEGGCTGPVSTPLHLSEPPRSFGSINTNLDVITLYSASSFPASDPSSLIVLLHPLVLPPNLLPCMRFIPFPLQSFVRCIARGPVPQASYLLVYCGSIQLVFK